MLAYRFGCMMSFVCLFLTNVSKLRHDGGVSMSNTLEGNRIFLRKNRFSHKVDQ